MIVKCHICSADPAGRWKQPPACIFHDPYAKGADEDPRGFLYACRSCLSATREEEIQARERDHWLPGTLR